MLIPTVVLLIAALVVAYWFPVRRWMSYWGATAADRSRSMPGDGLLPNPSMSSTMAIRIDAPPEDVWPWLVQIGYRRGGLYSYDWLDRLFGFLDRPSATRILPEFQGLAAGDHIPLGIGPSWPVSMAEPNQALVLDMRHLGGFDWVWQFGLYPIGENRTQLVTRNAQRPLSLWGWPLAHVIEPAGFIMTRRMLVGLKERAEALHAERVRETEESLEPVG